MTSQKYMPTAEKLIEFLETIKQKDIELNENKNAVTIKFGKNKHLGGNEVISFTDGQNCIHKLYISWSNEVHLFGFKPYRFIAIAYAMPRKLAKYFYHVSGASLVITLEPKNDTFGTLTSPTGDVVKISRFDKEESAHFAEAEIEEEAH